MHWGTSPSAVTERELSKWATIAEALQARGLDEETALLTASAGMLGLQTAIRTWARPDETRPLRELLPEALDSLRTIINP